MSLKRFKKEDGTTIIEVIVVMAIIAILSTITLGLVTSLFDSSLRTSKYLDQNNRIETMYGFFASRMASTNIGSVGLPGTGKIDPLTLAGDQFLFQSNGGGSTTGATLCYRVMYFKDEVVSENGKARFPARSVWVAVSGDCSDIKPVSGPNQDIDVVKSKNDPVLNPAGNNAPAGNPFQLAANITPTYEKYNVSETVNGQVIPGGGPNVCGGAGTEKTYQKDLVPFMFCNVSLGKLPVSNFAGVGTEGSFYAPSGTETVDSLLRDIRAVQVNAYVEAAGESSPVPVREYTQVFSLAQVCATETQVELTLPEPQGWREIRPTSGGGVATDPPFKNGWEAATSSQVSPAFYRDAATKRVYFRGSIKRTTSAPNIGLGEVIFTLPSGSTPPVPTTGSSSQLFLVPRGTGGGTATIEIKTFSTGTADVIFSGASNSGANTQSEVIYLDTISFRIS